MMRPRFCVPLLLAMVACQRPPAEASSTPPPAPEMPAAETPAAPMDAGTTEMTDSGAAAAPARKEPVARWTGLKTPESVIHDADRDRYLVSNINGKPVDADNNGFISELDPQGTVKTLHFIAGKNAAPAASGAGQGDAGAAAPKPVSTATLNAPKGLALAAGTLYVSDLNVVRMFDPATGKPKGEVRVAGATFLNDIAVGSDGKVYVADSGLKMGASGFEPTGTDAVYVLEKGWAKPIVKSKELDRPNGLAWTKDGLVVSSFGAGGVYLLDAKGTRQQATQLPKGGLDGVISLGEELFVSSWESKAVLRGKLGGTFTPVIEGLEGPADIGFDAKRKRLLVPRFMGDAVEAYAME